MAPLAISPRRIPSVLAIIAASWLLAAATPAHALRITTYNLTFYTPTNGTFAARQPYFRTIFGSLQTDIIVTQETTSQAGADSFLAVLQSVQPKRWGHAYIASTESGVYWDSSKVDIPIINAFGTNGPRDVLQAVVKPVGYVSNAAWFRVYSIHLKAGQTAADSTTRRFEGNDIRSFLNAVSSSVGPSFIIGGDTNFYGAYEGGYVALTQTQADNDGRCKDPLLMPGGWHENSNFLLYDTQCPCLTGCMSGFSGGGMDDRFDVWLSSYSLQDGQGLDLVLPGGYITYGNDGQHYNQDINGSGFNNAVGLTVATALHEASDHIPVITTIQLPAKELITPSALDFGRVIVGATAQQVVTVGNSAIPPADKLDYSFTTSAGFTAPAGGFLATAQAPPTAQPIGMETSAEGDLTGTLTVTTDDPDSASKDVLLSGTVIRHAAPSLASDFMSPNETVHLRIAGGGFADSTIQLFNLGFDAYQSKLLVIGADITGGDNRFSIVGGFSPTVIEGSGAPFTLHFDDAGATVDSTYQATLTFHSVDESLPGGTTLPDRIVTVVAGPASNTGVGPTVDGLRFEAPRPNPLSERTSFAFELPRAAPVSLEIYDLGGRRVASVVSGVQGAGPHQVEWNAVDARGAHRVGGLYFARFVTPGLSATARLIVLP